MKQKPTWLEGASIANRKGGGMQTASWCRKGQKKKKKNQKHTKAKVGKKKQKLSDLQEKGN